MAAPTKSDFENGPLNDHGVTVIRTPNTKEIDGRTGDRVDNFGTPVNISIVFENPSIVHDLIQPGETENSTVRAFVSGDVTINHEDLITWNSAVFRVDSVSGQYFDGNLIFKTVMLSLRTAA